MHLMQHRDSWLEKQIDWHCGEVSVIDYENGLLNDFLTCNKRKTSTVLHITQQPFTVTTLDDIPTLLTRLYPCSSFLHEGPLTPCN